jgi:hypothetical protein
VDRQPSDWLDVHDDATRMHTQEGIEVSIPEPCLAKLTAAGLLALRPFRMSRGGLALEGIRIAKPRSTPGNTLPGEEVTLSSGGVQVDVLDAPILDLYTNGASWFVRSHDWIPGPGPGDFLNGWSTVDEAIADVLDFYFGHPGRMAAKRSKKPRRAQ